MPNHEPVVSIRNLCKAFGEHVVLNHFDLDLYNGENLGILGKSGSGKSVLIKCIIGLLRPDSGTIRVFGQNIPDLNREQLDAVRVRVGFLFQSNALYDSMSVRENLEFPLRRHSIQLHQSEVNDMVMEALENVGLEDTVDRLPGELSGGMRKRIALARTLILKPEIILYDEPTTGLDSITALEIIELMLAIQKKYNTSSIIITHDMKCISLGTDRVTMLLDGKNYATAPYKILMASDDPNIKPFFH